VVGLLWRLVCHHWITEKPTPTSDQGVQAIIVTHKPTWRAHKDEIRLILADVIPQLERAKVRKRERLAQMRETGHAVSALKRVNEVRRREREKSARAIALPERTQTQTRINVEKRSERQAQNKFVETHF
jgi:uncharacterized protein YdaU (DUF1376 family)